MSITLVDDAGALAPALARLPAGPWGVDVERADSLRYHRRAALIQIGSNGTAVLVDPLAIDDLSSVDDSLEGHLCILHALTNDLIPLNKVGIQPTRMADTSVAAALLGLPTGLAPLMEDLLGLELAADKNRFQRADWEQRPLPEEMLEYAAGDVLELPALWAALEERLREAGRLSWYEQEIDVAVQQALDDSRSWEDVKGIGRLRPQARAVLRSLWLEREDIAASQDVAPNRIIHDKLLVDLAAHPPETPEGLVERSNRRRSVLRRSAGRLFDALRAGAADDPIESDAPSRRWGDEEREAHDRMRRARTAVAREIGIDPGVLCPGRLLWKAIAADPADGEQLCAAAGLRPWQVELLSEPLWEAYAGEGE